MENNGIEQLNEILKDLHEPKIVNDFIFYPNNELGYIDLDEIKAKKEDAPRRLEGKARLTSEESFNDYVNRFKDENSAVLFNENSAFFEAVFDFDIGGDDKAPRWGKHRAIYEAKASEELEFWKRYNEQWLGQMDFAAFLEKRCLDFIEAEPTTVSNNIKRLQMLLGGKFGTPMQIIELARGIEVSRGQKAKSIYNRSSGARSIAFEETDKGIDVPNLFMIAIPMFKNGLVYRLPAQLRFRIDEGEIRWQYEIHRLEESRKHAVDEMVTAVKEKTGLPVFFATNIKD